MNLNKKSVLYEDIYKSNFSFGKNWENFLKKLNEAKINKAKEHLLKFFGGKDKIEGKTILDFGCGSGLMSLCFYLLGAKKVVSVDIDKSSINCTNILKDKYLNNGSLKREILKGSILDRDFIEELGDYDIVYSWGVIHHTGNMRKGLKNVINLVNNKGLIYLAIYNESNIFLEGTSRFWWRIKKIYSGNKTIRPIIKMIYILYLILGLSMSGKNPFKYIKDYEDNSTRGRGMDFFTDIEDRLGGYPYEYSDFNKIKLFYQNNKFKLVNSTKVRSIGCNEFLLKKI